MAGHEYRARQKAAARDYSSGHLLITYEITDGGTAESLEAFRDKDLTLSVKQYRPKRSLDANSYYWKLLEQLAGKTHIGVPELHNMMLSAHGVRETVDGRLVEVWLPDTDEARKKAAENETLHLQHTNFVKDELRCYYLLRGSHEYDSLEMSNLISGVIEECRWQGIETMTPDEIARLKYDEEHYAV